jgi:hypothetical protein
VWLPSPWLKMLWENRGMSTWCLKGSYFVALCRPLLSPLRLGGFAPPFIDQGGGGLHARRAIQLRGEVRRAML